MLSYWGMLKETYVILGIMKILGEFLSLNKKGRLIKIFEDYYDSSLSRERGDWTCDCYSYIDIIENMRSWVIFVSWNLYFV